MAVKPTMRERMTRVESRLDGMAQDIDVLKADVSELKGDVKELKHGMIGVKQELRSLSHRIEVVVEHVDDGFRRQAELLHAMDEKHERRAAEYKKRATTERWTCCARCSATTQAASSDWKTPRAGPAKNDSRGRRPEAGRGRQSHARVERRAVPDRNVFSGRRGASSLPKDSGSGGAAASTIPFGRRNHTVPSLNRITSNPPSWTVR